MSVFFSAMIFALHPIHSEAVAGIVGRADILSGIFFLLALLAFKKHQKGQKESLKAKNSENPKAKKRLYSTDKLLDGIQQNQRHKKSKKTSFAAPIGHESDAIAAQLCSWASPAWSLALFL